MQNSPVFSAPGTTAAPPRTGPAGAAQRSVSSCSCSCSVLTQNLTFVGQSGGHFGRRNRRDGRGKTAISRTCKSAKVLIATEDGTRVTYGGERGVMGDGAAIPHLLCMRPGTAIRQADRMPHLILSSQYVRGIARPVSCRALVIEVFSVTECLQPAVLPAFVRKIADRDDLHLPPALRALNTIRFMSTHALPSAAAPVPCHLFHEARQHAIPGTARGAGTESFHQLQRHDQEGFINRNANH